MKCPICGKDVELRNKQVAVDEQGNPVFNQYAVCRDCKKQWNLDKKRVKKTSEKKETEKVSSETPVVKTEASVKKASSEKQVPVKKANAEKQAPTKKADAEKQVSVKKTNSEKQAPVKKTSAEKQASAKKAGTNEAPVKKANSEKQAPAKKAATEKQRPVKKSDAEKQISTKKAAANEASIKKSSGKPAPKKAPVKAASGEQAPVKKTAKPESAKKKVSKSAPAKTMVVDSTAVAKKAEKKMLSMDTEGQLGNIPSEKVRAKKERIVKQGYEDMLNADPKNASRKNKKTQTVSQPAPKAVKNEPEEYDDFEPIVRFRALRVIFGILSILIAAFYAYNSYSAGLMESTKGMTFLILAGCMGVAGLLLIILNGTNNIFAFLLPMILYLANGLYAFLNRGDDTFLLYSAIVGAAFSVLFIILAITSRGDEEDYENFDDEEDDDDDDWDDEDDDWDDEDDEF